VSVWENALFASAIVPHTVVAGGVTRRLVEKAGRPPALHGPPPLLGQAGRQQAPSSSGNWRENSRTFRRLT